MYYTLFVLPSKSTRVRVRETSYNIAVTGRRKREGNKQRSGEDEMKGMRDRRRRRTIDKEENKKVM